MLNRQMQVRGSGTGAPVIFRVPTGDVFNVPPVKSKSPLPDRVYTPVAVGNGRPSRARVRAPSGGAKTPTPQGGCKDDVPPLLNMKQPDGTPVVWPVRSLIIVQVCVPSVTVNGVNAGLSPSSTKLGTVKENEKASIPPAAPIWKS